LMFVLLIISVVLVRIEYSSVSLLRIAM
jgi:hypothetical protein